LIHKNLGSARPYGICQEERHSYLGSFDKFTVEDFRKMRLGYFASIALLDLEVGRILEALEEKGLTEDTIVIFTSDHGDMLGDHNLLVKGAFFYDPCVKVPLIIRWPQAKSRLRTPQLVQIHDLAATLLSAAGIPQEDLQQNMPESRTLESLIHGEDKAVHEFAICCYRNSGINDRGIYWDPPIHATMIRDERYKLNVYHADPLSNREMQGELYDMPEDVNELHNHWEHPAYKDVRMNLTEKLLDWMFRQEVRSGSRGGETIPDRSQQLVNALK
jgi:arylsulfatase A-like enzyme